MKLSYWQTREFHSVKLAQWLCEQQVYFVLRQKKDTLVQQKNQDYQELTMLDLVPGTSRFLTDVKVTKEQILLLTGNGNIANIEKKNLGIY